MDSIPEGDWFCNACSTSRRQSLGRRATNWERLAARNNDLNSPRTNETAIRPINPRRTNVLLESDSDTESGEVPNSRQNFKSCSNDSGRESQTSLSTQRYHHSNVVETSRAEIAVASQNHIKPSSFDDLALTLTGHGQSSTGIAKNFEAGQQRHISRRASQAYRTIENIKKNWESLRSEEIDFDDILTDQGSSSEARRPVEKRRRLISARQLSTTARDNLNYLSKRASENNNDSTPRPNPSPEFVDLTNSNSPTKTKQAVKSNADNRNSILSPPLLSLGSRLRAEISASRSKGSQLPPRRLESKSSKTLRNDTDQKRARAQSNMQQHAPRSGRSTLSQGDAKSREYCNILFQKREAGAGSSLQYCNRRSDYFLDNERHAITGSLYRPIAQVDVENYGSNPRKNTNPFRNYSYNSSKEVVCANPDGRSSPEPLVQRLQKRLNNAGTNSVQRDGSFEPSHGSKVSSISANTGYKYPNFDSRSKPNPSRDETDYSNLMISYMPETDLGTKLSAACNEIDGEFQGNASSETNNVNLKEKAYSMVKEELRVLFNSEYITREQYKTAAREATHMLYNKFKSSPDKMTQVAAALAIDEAIKNILS